MVEVDTHVRRGHPVIFGLILLFAIINGCLTAWLTARYNDHGYPSGHFQGTIRFGVFVSWWTVVFTILYMVSFLTGAMSFISSIASHGIWLFLTWIFWLAYAASTSAMLSGPGDCGGRNPAYCSQNVAAEAFGWIEFILFTVAFIFTVLLGTRAMRRGDGFTGPLAA